MNVTLTMEQANKILGILCDVSNPLSPSEYRAVMALAQAVDAGQYTIEFFARKAVEAEVLSDSINNRCTEWFTGSR